MSIESDKAALLRMEDRLLEAMMDVRYALDAGRMPEPAKLDTLRKTGPKMAEIAMIIHQKQEEEYRREHEHE